MKFVRSHQGILPPFMLLELTRRNPTETQYLTTLAVTQRLYASSPGSNDRLHHFAPVLAGAANADRETFDCEGTRKGKKKYRFEADPPGTDVEGNEAHDFTGAVRDYYRLVHGRVGIDAHSMKFVSWFNYDQDYNNAFWDGVKMTYGRPKNKIFRSFVLLDVCGHEVTHGVTEFVCGMEYYGQSGALNEHLSDVFGELIEMHAKKLTVDKADWVIGNGIFQPGIKGVGIRHMLNPGTAYNDPALGKDPQPAHMRDYMKMSGDNGGVHYNSGIPNRAFALFANDVGGAAWEVAGKIWYAARAVSSSKPSFAQFAQLTLDACKSVGHEGRVKRLKEIWVDGVGINPSATALDTDTPAPGGSDDEGGLPPVVVGATTART